MKLHKDLEASPKGRREVLVLVALYIIFLVFLCWSPQNWELSGVTTPNIIKVGRLVFLLVPFNSFVAFSELKTAWDLVWVLGQNIANIFLLFPLIIGLLIIFPGIRDVKKVVRMSFLISLTIEVGQLLLDFFIDANRVFELDDLWTNTLGGYLAYVCYRFVMTKWRKNGL